MELAQSGTSYILPITLFIILIVLIIVYFYTKKK